MKRPLDVCGRSMYLAAHKDSLIPNLVGAALHCTATHLLLPVV